MRVLGVSAAGDVLEGLGGQLVVGGAQIRKDDECIDVGPALDEAESEVAWHLDAEHFFDRAMRLGKQLASESDVRLGAGENHGQHVFGSGVVPETRR